MSDAGLISYVVSPTGFSLPIDVEGGYAYVGELGFDRQMLVYDLSDPTAPLLVSIYDSAGNQEITDIDVIGDHVYLSNDANGLVKLDVSDPTNPTFAASYNGGSYANSFDTDDGVYGFVTYSYTAGQEVQIHDLASFASAPVATYDATGTRHATNVDVVGGLAFMTTLDGGPYLDIVDVSDPTSPFKISSFILDEPSYGAVPGVIEVSGDYLFWATSSHSTFGWDGGLLILDISDGTAPVVAGSDQIPDAGYYHIPGGAPGPGLDVVEDMVYLVSRTGLYIYDVSDPTAPEVVVDPNVDLEFAFPEAFDGSQGGWVEVVDGIAYVTSMGSVAGQGGLAVFDVNLPEFQADCDLFRFKDLEGDVGDVTLTYSDDLFTVAVSGEDGWTVTKAKLHIGDIDAATGDLSGFPVSPAGNPKVGKFNCKETAVENSAEFEFLAASLLAADSNGDGVIAIAVHAEIEALVPGNDGLELIKDDAWGACDDLAIGFPGNSGATIIEIELADLGIFV